MWQKVYLVVSNLFALFIVRNNSEVIWRVFDHCVGTAKWNDSHVSQFFRLVGLWFQQECEIELLSWSDHSRFYFVQCLTCIDELRTVDGFDHSFLYWKREFEGFILLQNPKYTKKYSLPNSLLCVEVAIDFL